MKHLLRSLALVLVLGLAMAQALGAFDLDRVSKAALEGSPTYRQALLGYLKAKNAVPDLLTLEDSTLSATPVLTTDSNGALVVNMDTSLTLPILEQLTLKASLNLDLDATLGLTVNPLAHSASRDKALIALEEARLTVSQTAKTIQSKAAAAILGWVSSTRTTERASETTRLAQLAWQDSRDKNRLDSATTTADDVRDALKTLSDARSAELKARSSLKTAETTMLGVFGANWTRYRDSWAATSLEELQEALRVLQTKLPSGVLGDDVDALVRDRAASGKTSETVQLSRLAVSKAQKELDATWIYDPSLNLTGQLGFDAAGGVAWSAGVVFSLSPNDFQLTQRDEQTENLRILQVQADADLLSDEAGFRQALLAIPQYQSSRKAQETVVEATRELHGEYQLLKEYGDASELEVAQAANDLASAQDSLFAAVTQEYLAWLDLAGWYGLGSGE